MGFLAIKNERVCAFNNREEMLELIDLYFTNDTKLFKNNEKEKALLWANVEKVYGFLMDYSLKNFKTLKELKNKGCSCVKIKINTGKEFCFMLNTTYYLNTNSFLQWNPRTKELEKESFSNKEKIISNFENSIINYARLEKYSLQEACNKYFHKFKDLYYRCPWNIFESDSFYTENGEIVFSTLCEKMFMSSGIKILKMKGILSNYKIKDEDILEITPIKIPREFTNKTLINIIKKNKWT